MAIAAPAGRLAAAVLLSLAFAIPATAADATFPIASRLGLVPPPGMTAAKGFPGFENRDAKAFIRLVALPEGAFAEIEKTMTDEALLAQGMTIDSRETSPVAGGKGILVAVRQTVQARPNSADATAAPESVALRKWLLVAPIDSLTAMVSFEMPAAEPAPYSETAIRAAFATLASRPHIPDSEQLGLVPFKVGDNAGLRLARVLPGVAAQFTDGPNDTFETLSQSHLVIGIAPGGPGRPDDRDRFARQVFGGLPPLKDVRITSSETLRINGQPGHEMRAQGKDEKTGAEIEIVQWLRFSTNAYLRLLGIGPKDKWSDTFTRFRTVRDSVEPR